MTLAFFLPVTVLVALPWSRPFVLALEQGCVGWKRSGHQCSHITGSPASRKGRNSFVLPFWKMRIRTMLRRPFCLSEIAVDPSQPATERADSDALDRDIFTRGTTRAEYAVLVPKANGTPRSRTASSSDSVAERSHLGKMGVCSSASMPPPLPDDAPNHPVAEAMTTRCTQ